VLETAAELVHASIGLPIATETKAGVFEAPKTGALLTAAQLRRAEPFLNPSLHGAVLYPNSGSAHPAKTVRVLREEALRAGVVVIEGMEVSGVARKEKNGKKTSFPRVSSKFWELTLRTWPPPEDVGDEGDADASEIHISAADVVIAAGAASQAVAELAWDAVATPTETASWDTVGKPFLGVVPVLGMMFSTRPLILQDTGSHSSYSITSDKKMHHSAT
jgi:glycine/D-amino acid oxidase-like deaminating enzyme